jgi:predicted GNAT family N-acyltransferase
MSTKLDVICAPPAGFSDHDLEAFSEFVLAGDEVSPNGLPERIRNAAHLSFAKLSGALVGVAGLKQPTAHYRQETLWSAKASLAVGSYPFELGWVYVVEQERRKGHSRTLCHPLIEAAQGRGILATTRMSNLGMQSTLRNLGFVRCGSSWPSKRVDEDLVLFARLPVST